MIRMNRLNGRRAGALVCALAAVALTNADTSAQVRARTAAISDDRVVLHVTASTGLPADLTIRNGEMGRITFFDGLTLGLTPVLQFRDIRQRAN
jgi:hypothetical protein